MVDTINRNAQFLLACLGWAVAGYLFDAVAAAVILPFLLLFWTKGMYAELLYGFIFILVLSDNVFPDEAKAYMSFAKDFKNVYILFLLFVFILDFRSLTTENQLFRLMIPFTVIAFICIAYSPNAFISFQKTLSFAILFLVAPCIFVKCYMDGGVTFLKDFLYVLLLLILIGFFFTLYNPDVCYSHGGRYRGIFGNPNGLGVFLIISFLLFFSITNYYPDLLTRQEKIIFWSVFLYCTFITGSRNALLAILLFLLFVRIFKWSFSLGIVFFLITLVVTEYVVANFANIVVNLGLQNIFRIDTLEEGSGRFIAWSFAWDAIQQSVFIGRGFAYDEYLMRSNFEYLSQLGHEGGVHNTYLIIWLNTGFIGLLAFLRAMLLIFVQASRNTPIAIPILLTILFSINFEPWLAASLNPYTILLICVIVFMTHKAFQSTTPTESEPLISQHEKTSEGV